MKLINYLENISPCQNIRLFDEDGNMVFMGVAGQIQESIIFIDWEVIEHQYHTDSMRIWIR